MPLPAMPAHYFQMPLRHFFDFAIDFHIVAIFSFMLAIFTMPA